MMNKLVDKIQDQLLWRHWGLNDLKPLLEEHPELLTWKGRDGESFLHSMAYSDAESIVEYLITEKGIPVDIQDRYGYTPLHEAIGRDSDESIRVLLKLGASCAIYNNDHQTPIDLLEPEQTYTREKIIGEERFQLNQQMKVEYQKLVEQVKIIKKQVNELLLPEEKEEEFLSVAVELKEIQEKLQKYLELRPGGTQMLEAKERFEK